MKFNQTPLPGVVHIELDVHRDDRGYFLESFQAEKYAQGGIVGPFVQDNVSRSTRGTLRGLHAQVAHPQAKLVQAMSGEIWDVVVDIRPNSSTYKKWFGLTLSSENPAQLFVPVGYAHGFCVLSETAQVAYKCSDFYDQAGEIHLLWNDPDLGIAWPIHSPVLSAKDRAGNRLKEIENKLKSSL